MVFISPVSKGPIMAVNAASTTETDWREVLEQNGYRLTQPLMAVIGVMEASSRALSPMEVFDTARESYPKLGLVTVYRSLEKLEEIGLVQRVHQPDECSSYIAARAGHQHLLICQSCGLTRYFGGDNIEALMSRVEQETGFTIQAHWLQLFGACPDCRKLAAERSDRLFPGSHAKSSQKFIEHLEPRPCA
jgi:Fe2+ or Zn2+ uptake regulation protein